MKNMSNNEKKNIIVTNAIGGSSNDQPGSVYSKGKLPPTIKVLEGLKNKLTPNLNRTKRVLKITLGGNGFFVFKDFGQDYVGKEGKELFDLQIIADKIDLFIQDVSLQVLGNINHNRKHMRLNVFFNTSFMELEDNSTIITKERTDTFSLLEEAYKNGKIINNSDCPVKIKRKNSNKYFIIL
ncbi:MAG: hypothetical protein ABIA04_15410 [Pseudomonadota bacterium]